MLLFNSSNGAMLSEEEGVSNRIVVHPFKAVAFFQQHIPVLSPVSEMERGSSEPPVARNTGSASYPSTGPMPIPRSSSVSCHPHPGSKKHKRTPLYQRSVRGYVSWSPC